MWKNEIGWFHLKFPGKKESKCRQLREGFILGGCCYTTTALHGEIMQGVSLSPPGVGVVVGWTSLQATSLKESQTG